jgi:hypothetical protein
MNHTTFNDGFVLGLDTKIMENDGTLTTLIPDSIVTAPIFVWDDFEDDKLISSQNNDVNTRIINEPNLLPFKTMRLWVNANLSDSQDGTRGFKAWISHHDNKLFAQVRMLGPEKTGLTSLIFTSGYQDENTSVKLHSIHRLYGKVIPLEKIKASPYGQALGDQCMAIFTSICWFIREVTSPANFVASVTPNKTGKSVEWTKARTHYVLIHKAHPANRQGVAKGSSVTIDNSHITRQAHTRRAHVRVLRSPRFRHKLGQTITVRSCWVGPDEWTQNGSIYKLQK